MSTQTQPPPSRQSRAVTPRPDPRAVVAELDGIATKYSRELAACTGRFERALVLSDGIKALKGAIESVVGEILHLQNSPLGFLTDKRDTGYAPNVVAECMVEATLRGVYPVGNEFNIIAGRCYITQNGYKRLVRELPGLTDLKLLPGVPKASVGGAVVPFRATWKLNGKADALDREIPIKMNSGMGVDALIGKATRKMLASIYGQITGSEHSDGDADEGDVTPTHVVVAPPTGRQSLRNGGTPPAPAQQEAKPQLGGIRAAQRSRLAELANLVPPDAFDAAILRRRPAIEQLTADEADAVIAELLPLSEQGDREPTEWQTEPGANG